MNTEVLKANLFSLTYVSSARALFGKPELVAILEVSRRNNTASNVTGMLLYHKGSFMQVLEGPEEAVRQAHERIARDPRHNGLITLLERPVAERQFGEWSMGFRDLEDPALKSLPGYSDFLNGSLTSAKFAENPSRAQKLLLSFKQNM